MKKIFFLHFALLLLSTSAFSQQISVAEYINEYKDFAIREMKRMGVPAAITLAQGILETQSGNSDLVKKSNNHFGIKCKSSWTAEGVAHDDDAPGECFRIYKTAEDSYRDHSNFLRGSERYSFLFKLDPRDYKGWAKGLRKAGYATNPRYPDILIKNIEVNNLQQYTLAAVDEVPVYDGSKFEDDKEVEVISDEVLEENGAINTNSPVSVIIKINGCKSIIAGKGTSLLLIATEQKINLSKLLEWNDLGTDGLLEKNQIIFLEKKKTEGEFESYISKQNESLYDVAQKNGVQLKSICLINKISPEERISNGTKIYLRPKLEKAELVRTGENDIAKVHEVQAREGLYGIAKKYGVSVDELKEWNGLKGDSLQIGQELIISK